MKYLLALLLMLPALSFGQEGIFYNPERDGEGINVFIRNETLSLMFFTYYDAKHDIVPIPSPPPPKPIELCLNESTWYIGLSQDWNGDEAHGDLFVSRPLDYPNVDTFNDLNMIFKVGTFTAKREDEGYSLDVISSGYLPADLFIFNNTFHFTKLIID